VPVKNFIEEYLRVTDDLESPTSYLKWGALSCISAVLRNNVYFRFPNRMETVYPNLYILLLGITAAVRKSNPMNITRDLVKNTNNTKVMAGAATMQGVLKELGSTETGKPHGGSGIMIAKELDAFFVKDPNTVSVLTDLFDYHPEYKKILISYEMPPIKEVCLSLFAGSNEVMMRNLFDQRAIEGGLLGRFFVVKEDKKRKSNSGFEDDAKMIDDSEWDEARTFLKILSTVKGPMIFTEEARRFYNDWYHSLDDKNYDTKTGFEHRIQTHAIKLATVLSASKAGFNRTIEMFEIQEAINECGKLMQTYKKLTLGTGKSIVADTMALVVRSLLECPNYHMTHKDLMISLFGETDVDDIKKAIDTLVQTDFVEEASMNMVPGYRCTKKLLDKMLENKKAKSQSIQ